MFEAGAAHSLARSPAAGEVAAEEVLRLQRTAEHAVEAEEDQEAAVGSRRRSNVLLAASRVGLTGAMQPEGQPWERPDPDRRLHLEEAGGNRVDLVTLYISWVVEPQVEFFKYVAALGTNKSDGL